MVVSLNNYSLSDGEEKGQTIQINMEYYYQTTMIEGLIIDIPKNGSNYIFEYLATNVVKYYLDQNCKGMKLDTDYLNSFISSNWLKSGGINPLTLEYSKTDSHGNETDLYFFMKRIFKLHNLNEDLDMLIDSYKSKIAATNLSESTIKSIEKSNKRFDTNTKNMARTLK